MRFNIHPAPALNMVLNKLIRIPVQAFKALLTCLMFFPVYTIAQAVNQVKIFPTASLSAHPNSNLNIFSDISHAGSLVSYDTSLINFYASVWQNENGNRLPDESASGIDGVGGIFTFSGLKLIPQQIVTISPQPNNGFPNLRLDNLQNVTVQTGMLHVNNNLDFRNGHLILNNVDVNVGRPGTGTLTGYSHTDFIVTGSGITGGSLIRKVTGTPSALVFPVGTAPGTYTPASVSYTGSTQTIKLRVADYVYKKLNFPEYVNKTWVVALATADPAAKMTLTLQHNSPEEGIEYFRNRTESYISRYDPNLTGLWDIIPPTPSVTPGTLTTRSVVFNAYMDTRLDVSVLKPIEYFTKSVLKKDIDENTPISIPDAISPNGDGFNDAYIIVKRMFTDVVRLEVYSRNQVLVYQNLDYLNTFDGTGNMGGFLGDVLPDGIYYYLISVNGAKGIRGYLIINR